MGQAGSNQITMPANLYDAMCKAYYMGDMALIDPEVTGEVVVSLAFADKLQRAYYAGEVPSREQTQVISADAAMDPVPKVEVKQGPGVLWAPGGVAALKAAKNGTLASEDDDADRPDPTAE
jgi:hypothetical protein